MELRIWRKYYKFNHRSQIRFQITSDHHGSFCFFYQNEILHLSNHQIAHATHHILGRMFLHQLLNFQMQLLIESDNSYLLKMLNHGVKDWN